MANFVFNEAKRAYLAGEFDMDTDVFKVVLVMTNTTADTEDDVNLMNGFTTLDECDGASYARQVLANKAINEDASNDRAEFDADDAQFASLGAGARNNQAAIIYKHVTDDTDSIPVAYIDTGGFPFQGNGGNIDVQWNVEGILQAA